MEIGEIGDIRPAFAFKRLLDDFRDLLELHQIGVEVYASLL